MPVCVTLAVAGSPHIQAEPVNVLDRLKFIARVVRVSYMTLPEDAASVDVLDKFYPNTR